MVRADKKKAAAKKAASSSSSSSSSAPPTTAPTPAPTAPVHQAPVAPAPKQPGLLAQAAATGAGVAVGSSVGHAVGNMLTGGSKSTPAASAPAQKSQICEFELKQLQDCFASVKPKEECTDLFNILSACMRNAK